MKEKKEKIEYVFIKDYKIANKKAGDPIFFRNGIPLGLRKYVGEKGSKPVQAADDSFEAIPDDSWTNPDIIDWLLTKGVEAKGTKKELLDEVKKVSKKK